MKTLCKRGGISSVPQARAQSPRPPTVSHPGQDVDVDKFATSAPRARIPNACLQGTTQLHLESQAVVLHSEVKSGRCHVEGDPLSSVERHLEGGVW